MIEVLGKIEFEIPQSQHTPQEIEEMFAKNPKSRYIDEDWNGDLFPEGEDRIRDEEYCETIIITHWRPE